jgi:hypothetical protein
LKPVAAATVAIANVPLVIGCERENKRYDIAPETLSSSCRPTIGFQIVLKITSKTIGQGRKVKLRLK